MTNVKDQDLDRILQEWASTHASDKRDLEVLEQRILRQFPRKPAQLMFHLFQQGKRAVIGVGVGVGCFTATAAALVLVSLAVHKLVVR